MFKDKIAEKKRGGDDNTSLGIVVPINKIPEYMIKIIGEIDEKSRESPNGIKSTQTEQE